MANFPAPPPVRTPFLDATGQISRDWYLWFQQIQKALSELQAAPTP